MDILHYILDKAFQCESCLSAKLNGRGQNGPVIEELSSEYTFLPCMALPPETEEEWALGIRNCAGDKLYSAMAIALSGDMEFPFVPYLASEVLEMISAIPYFRSDYEDIAPTRKEIYTLKRKVWGTCVAIIDYILLKRRYDANKLGQVYNVDALDICQEMGRDYSREKYLRPLMTDVGGAAKYSALVDGLVSEPCPYEVCLSEPIPKRKSSRRANGQYDVWAPKVDKKAFRKHFIKEFQDFDDLVEKVEKKNDWKKIDLFRLAYLLLYSGYVTGFSDFTNWSKQMYIDFGLKEAVPSKINRDQYGFTNALESVYYKNEYPYLFRDEFGKNERKAFGL